MREVTKENSWGLQQLWVSVSFQLWFGSPGWGFYCRTRRLLHDLSSSLWLIDLWAKSGRFFPATDVRSSLGCSGISAGPAARWGLRGFCGPSVCGGLPFPSPDWRGERTAVGKLLCRREHLGSPLVLIDCHPMLMRSRTSARCNGCSLRVTIVGRLCLRNCAQQMWGKKKKKKISDLTIPVCLEILTALTLSCLLYVSRATEVLADDSQVTCWTFCFIIFPNC